MWELYIADRDKVLPILPEIAEQARTKHGITIRKMSRRHLRRDLDEFAKVYNAAWSSNWGFVPYSKEDLDAYALDLQLVFDRDWFMVAENDTRDRRDGDHDPGHQPGAQEDEGPRCCRSAGGTTSARKRIIDGVRVGFLGVLPEYQHTGVAALLYMEHFDMAAQTPPQVRRGGLDPRDQQAR